MSMDTERITWPIQRRDDFVRIVAFITLATFFIFIIFLLYVFAAGDVTCTEVRQVITAASNCAVAALPAEKYLHHRRAQIRLRGIS